MTTRSIQLGGITTGTATETAADGDLREALNLRQKQGKYLPVRENRIEFTAGEALLESHPDLFPGRRLPDDYSLLYIHRTDNYEHWISYAGGSLWFEMKKEDGRFTAAAEKIADIDRPGDIESMGNILICILPGDIHYFLYNDGYQSIQEIRAPLDIRFSTRTVQGEGLTNGLFTAIDINGKHVKEEITNDTPVHAFVYQTLADMKSEGLIPGLCLIRYAYRLYDGSWICQSPPLLVMGKDGSKSIYFENNYNGQSAPNYWYFHAWAYEIMVEAQQNDILYQNRDIIQAVDIFMAEISPFDNTDQYSIDRYQILTADGILTDSFEYASAHGKLPFVMHYTPFAMEKLRDKIIQAADFRLVDSIKTSELSKNISRSVALKGKLENLRSLERLPDDEFSHNTVTAQTAFTYNSRLHLADITTRLFSGFTLQTFNTHQKRYNYTETVAPKNNGSETFRVENSYIETLIKTDTGTARVVAQAGAFDLLGIVPYLSYPDPRAYRMTIVCRFTNNCRFTREFDLTPSDSLNLAYYVPANLKQLLGSYTTDDTPLTPPDEENHFEHAGNKLKVSAPDTPFAFPVEQTYIIGTGSIVGIAAATEALSQGQFGQFPLYLFTSDGIWTLETGSDSIVYTRQTPLSRDICSNPDSITPLDSAIAFASAKGVMLLSGSRVSPLSESVILPPAPLRLPADAAAKLGLPTLLPAQGTPPFGQYLQSARIGYNYPEKEIYVTNPAYDHYYACAVDTGRWSRRQGRIVTLIDNYPLLYGIDTDRRVLNLTAEEGDTRPVTLLTRPLKLSGQNYKRLSRTILRGLFSGPLQGFLFGSDDGIRFHTVNHIAGTASQHRDLLWGHTVKPFKYYLIAFTAQAGADIEIDYLDAAFDEQSANRLR